MGFWHNPYFQVDYQKDAARLMTQHSLPADAPEFIRAKEVAKNASDVSHTVISLMVVAQFVSETLKQTIFVQ